MTNHDAEKKKWELEQCQLVAAEMNKSQGTDYDARPSDAEPADVILKSKSEAHPPLPVQVVSIPLDFRHRDDKHSVEKIREALKRSLEEHGFNHCSVGLILSGEAEMHGIKHAELELLTETVLKEAANGNRTLKYEDILELSPKLSELVHDIIISHHEELQNADVDIPSGSAVPPDGRWIREGILKKVDKYGGAEAVKDLVLVIGVAGFVDDEQIQAFQTDHPSETLPFSQIWIVTTFHGVVCLKHSDEPTVDQKSEQDLTAVEQKLKIKALRLQIVSYRRDLSKKYFWREWLKAATPIIALIGIVSTMIWTVVQNTHIQRMTNAEERARRFESAVNRLGSKEANARLTGIAGLSQFVKDRDQTHEAGAWNSMIEAIALEEDPVVQAALFDAINSLSVSQPILDDSLALMVILNRSQSVSILRPAVEEAQLQIEPLARSRKLRGMATGIDILVRKGARTKDFSSIYCVFCDFRKISGDHITFHGAFLDNANFLGVTLPSADFSSASLLGANFNNSVLQNANFDNANGTPFFWYESFSEDPDSPTKFNCADLTGSSFNDFGVLGFNIANDHNKWWLTPVAESAEYFFGTNLSRVKMEDLHVYYIAVKGDPHVAEIDKGSQFIFKDVEGHERWIADRVVANEKNDSDTGILASRDNLIWGLFYNVGYSDGAELPEGVKEAIRRTADEEKVLRLQIEQRCRQWTVR